MKRIITAKLAGRLLVLTLILLTVFHVLVLLKIVPSDIIWGGQIADSDTSLLTLELISLAVTLFFLVIAAARMGWIVSTTNVSGRIVRGGLWIMCVYFVLNTLGNLASGVSIENLVFAPISILLAVLSLRLAIER